MFEEHALIICLDDIIIDNYFNVSRHLLTIFFDKENAKIKKVSTQKWSNAFRNTHGENQI